MHVVAIPLGPLQTNSYIVAKGAQAVAVDPAGEPAPILDYLEKHGLTLSHILNTHLHFDHTYGNKALADATGAPILHSKEDMYLLESELGKGGAFGLPPVEPYDGTVIAPGDLDLGDMQCTAFLTPGHSLGSMTYYFPEAPAAFVGDLVFYRSIGRTDFPGGDIEVLKQSVRDHVFTLPPETVLYSGHGPETTVGDEMNHNPFFSEF